VSGKWSISKTNHQSPLTSLPPNAGGGIKGGIVHGKVVREVLV